MSTALMPPPPPPELLALLLAPPAAALLELLELELPQAAMARAAIAATARTSALIVRSRAGRIGPDGFAVCICLSSCPRADLSQTTHTRCVRQRCLDDIDRSSRCQPLVEMRCLRLHCRPQAKDSERCLG